ncbi:MAG: sigma 54-interacting transcriptional regulator [Terriglobales bacterium]
MAKDPSSSSRQVNARYHALLEFSAATAAEPNLQAVLERTFALLSSIIPFGLIALLLLEEERGLARLHFLKTGSGHPTIDVGTELSLKGSAVERAIDEQKPVLVEDGQGELKKFPELAARLKNEPIRSFYAFPVSTSRRRLGVLIVATESAAFNKDDVELMGCVASHLSVTLEGALALESAGEYRREIVHERDRLKLLLEITNHVMTRLEMDDFFRAASASIRRFFGNDVTGFWLLDEQSRRLNCAVLDFPSSRTALTRLDIPEVTEQLMEKISMPMPFIQTLAEFEKQFPLAVSAPLRAESIVSFAHVPLVARHRPIAAMSLGSRHPNAFSEGDLDLLTQVASQIALALDNALAYERLNASRNHLEDQRVYLESEIVSESGFEDIIGKSRALRKVLDQISIVAPADSTVVIHGETGTGKELVARAIHQRSSRSGKTFVRLNCAAIPSGLLESELFGHERGAFTGALAQRRGRFELADQGTLFLDEIGDISLDVQPKLLRAIQEHEFERLGSSRTIHVNVRLIAATHKDLRKMIGEGAFREDLFYRLNVFPIEVPPLRERREDIPLLVRYFVSRLCRRMRKSITNIPRETMDALVAWDWPGNVRELENLIERAVILSPKDRLNAPLAELAPSRAHVPSVLTFRDGERNTIITALKAAKGRIGGQDGAAERLGLKRTTLLTKMRKLNIAVERSTAVRGPSNEHC